MFLPPFILILSHNINTIPSFFEFQTAKKNLRERKKRSLANAFFFVKLDADGVWSHVYNLIKGFDGRVLYQNMATN